MTSSELLDHLPFALKVESEGMGRFLQSAESPTTLQLNITKRCNLACKHCHVGSGPALRDEMDESALKACLAVFAEGPFTTLDITGGAPELNTHYCWLIKEAAGIAAEKRVSGLVPHVITRTNAAILTQPGFEDLPKLWAELGIEVVASLPHYEERKTNRMRGEGVFEQVVAGLGALNAAGYGKDGSKLILNIAVNPGGAILPPSQASAELEFRKKLGERFGIAFNNLLVIANNPVGRFQDFLESRGMLDTYMLKLYDAFNPATVESAMCRSQISVDVEGILYDCDFNQIVELPILETYKEDASLFEDSGELGELGELEDVENSRDAGGLGGREGAAGKPLSALTIFDLQRDGLEAVSRRKMRVSGHCYACTAGAGSSCGGATA